MYGYFLRNGAQILQLIIFILLILNVFADREKLNKRAKWLASFALAVLIGWGAFLSIAQHRAWSKGGFGVYLLPPHTPISYFIQYILTNILSVAILGLVMALVNVVIVAFIGKIRPHVMEGGEVAVVAVCSLVLLWPSGILLLPLVLIISAVQSVLTKQPVTITFALIFSTLILMLSGADLFHWLKLPALLMGKW